MCGPCAGCLARDDRPVVLAVGPDGTVVAQRFRPADTAAVEYLHVRGSRPEGVWQRPAQLRLDLHRIVALGDANPIGNTQDVPIDGQSRYAERVAKYDVGRLAPDAGQLCRRRWIC